MIHPQFPRCRGLAGPSGAAFPGAPAPLHTRGGRGHRRLDGTPRVTHVRASRSTPTVGWPGGHLAPARGLSPCGLASPWTASVREGWVPGSQSTQGDAGLAPWPDCLSCHILCAKRSGQHAASECAPATQAQGRGAFASLPQVLGLPGRCLFPPEFTFPFRRISYSYTVQRIKTLPK